MRCPSQRCDHGGGTQDGVSILAAGAESVAVGSRVVRPRNLLGGWCAGSSARGGLCHGAGLAGQRSLEGGAQAACSERRPWKRSRPKRQPASPTRTTLEAARTFPSEKTGGGAMARANGRRNGAGDPEPWPAKDGRGVGVGSPGMDAGCRRPWTAAGPHRKNARRPWMAGAPLRDGA